SCSSRSLVITPDMSGTSPSSESNSWTCQAFMSPYCALIRSHCSDDVSISIRKVETSLLRMTSWPPSNGKGPRCTKSGSYNFAVRRLLIYTPPPISCCAPRGLPILRIHGTNHRLRSTTNHRHPHMIHTRTQRKHLIIAGLHALPNQTRLITNASFTWFSHNPDRRRNLTLDEHALTIRPNNLNILTRPSNLPHRPRRGVTLNP